MNRRSLKQSAVVVLLGLASVAAGAAPIDSAQDQDNPLACCLASEWTLAAVPHQPRARSDQDPLPLVTQAPVTGTIHGQVELGDLSCCIGAEWVLPSGEDSRD